MLYLLKVKERQSQKRGGEHMSVISDTIEQFILAMLNEEGKAELQRNELAQYFACAPSQINYVLTTRFNLDRGYIIESRRGGGGYIRIMRVNIDKDNYLHRLITERIANTLTVNEANDLINQLYVSHVVNAHEANLMLAATSETALALPAGIKNTARANILKEMLITIMKNE
jgi:transcriptional regulator CtsR